eukprot:RCo055049
MSSSARNLFTTTYLPPEGTSNLLRYKYAGCDRSPIYRHILTPMNDFLIKWFPLWIAPNTITVTGLLLVVISHFVTCYYCPLLKGNPPAWVYILNGLCLFGYQTLDNLDGKQARRTGSSSPLGMFMDHACDAVNTTVSALTMASTLQTGTTVFSLLLLTNSVSVFMLNTWEEYYTGELVLPYVNGSTEGILVACALHFWTAFVGGSWWLHTVQIPLPFVPVTWVRPGGWLFQLDRLLGIHALPIVGGRVPSAYLPYNAILVLLMAAGAAMTCIGHILTVRQAVSGRGTRSD